MPATAMVVDFSDDDTLEDAPPLTGTREPISIGSKGGVRGRPITSKEKKQIRQRARRKLNKLAPDEQEALWGKDISQWDMEELARGRPRAADGSWKGKAPGFINRQMHEEIVRRFESIVREEMNGHTIHALEIIEKILLDEERDDKGKRVTPRGTQLEAAKFLIEHVIGKPKQRTETDISVKLQGILGHAMVMPTETGEGLQLTQGFIEAESWEDEADDNDGD